MSTPRFSAKTLIGVGVLLFVLAMAAAARLAVTFNDKLAYRTPIAAPAAPATPHAQALEDQAKAKAEADRSRPYVEAEYRRFPVVGSRVAIWVVAQLHLLFAAFVLAVPIFAVIIEFIGFRTKDPRYDELAHEFTKLLACRSRSPPPSAPA